MKPSSSAASARSGRSPRRPPQRPTETGEAAREASAVRQRYVGAAILAVAILLFWSFRILLARWSG